MDPTNYWGSNSPFPTPQPVTAGIDALQQQQQESATRALAANQVQMQLRQQQLQQAALQDALQNPSPTTYRALALVDPSRSAAVKQAYDGLDEEAQRQSLQDLTAFHNYHAAGRPDDANAIIQRHIDAAKKAGQPTDTWEALKNLDPKQAQVAAGMMLSTIGGADKMASAYGAMGKEGRDQAGFPVEQALKQAQAAEANANAQAKLNPPPQTEVNPQTGQYYNKNAPPPASGISSTSGALDGVVQQIIQSESGGSATAKNPGSSATGAGQFLSGTWIPLIKQLHPELSGKSDQQLLDLRKNPNLAAEATAAYAQDNAAKLSAAGLPVTATTIAMAHKLGPQGAQAVLSADANTPLSQVLPPDVIAANPQLAKLTAGQYGQGLAKTFGTTPIDTTPGDPNASGEDFLRTLPPARARQIQAIANGDLPLPTGRAATSGPGQALAQQVLQYDPTASTINLQARQATRKAFTSGMQGQSIVQANTVGGHLAALDALVDTLNNGPVPAFNAVAQTVEPAIGNQAKQKALTNFNTLKATLAPELVKFYRSNGGSEADIQSFLKLLDPSNPQLHTAIAQISGAVLSKIGALNDSYNSGMGKVTEGLNLPNVNHNAIAQLQRLAGESTFGGNAQGAGASGPQVYVNPKTGERIAYDQASKSWKPAT